MRSPRAQSKPLRGLAAGLAALFLLASPSADSADLLRSGAGISATTPAPGTTAANPSATTPTGLTTQDRLARTAQALQAVKAMQAAAQALAASGAANLGPDPNHAGRTLPNVPNGLGVGALQVAPGSTWLGAAAPTQSTSGAATTVTVTQSAPQALLTWQSFNVGKETTLVFDQTAGGADAGQWIAFNKVVDPTAVPSQILGSIKADGQVYVINPNGIIFGGASQVNAHALVASSLPLNDNLVTRGLLNNPDEQFLFSSLPLVSGSNGPTPAFTPDALPAGLTQPGDVTVQAGAQLTAPTSDAHVGGRIALIGPNVTNAGTISTPDGQTVLAAGLQVGFAAHSTDDPSLRGLDVYVGQVGTAGTATNSGLINAPRADVTVTGKTVSQLGYIESSTSVALNGRVDLLASYNAVSSGGLFANLDAFVPTSTGLLTFGDGSVTRILPEFDSTDTVTGALALNSQVNARGQVIHLAGSTQLVAPSATVNFDAGTWSLTGATISDGVIRLGSTPRYSFLHGGADATTGGASQIYLDSGATIDVAGSAGVKASVAENFVSVQLRGSELADYPLQRDGALRGQTIQIDARQTGTYNGKTWVGTPLADTSGYVALIERTVGELTTAGGTVNLNAGGSVVLQSGSKIDVSGGWTNFQAATVQTTQVIADGHVYDISQATPDRVYQGIYTGASSTANPRWGATDTTTNPLLPGVRVEPGYVQGANGGSLNITAPSMALDGTLQGGTVSGPWQRSAAPTPSALRLAFLAQDASYVQLPTYSPTPPKVTLGNAAALAAAQAFTLDAQGNPAALGSARRDQVVLSPSLFANGGFGRLEINNHDGSVVIPAGTDFATPAGGGLSVTAANIDIEGKVTAPGGTLSFTATDGSLAAANALTYTPAGAATPPGDDTRGRLVVGAGAALSTAGLITDDRGAAGGVASPIARDGGSVTLKGRRVQLAAGSALDVSGGAAVTAAGKVSYGNGGSITVAAGQDPELTAVIGGGLDFQARVAGFSGARGGTLSLLAPAIRIGGAAGDPRELALGADFFSTGGFATFNLTGLGLPAGDAGQFLPALEIASGTRIAPVVQGVVANLDPAGVTLVPVTQAAGVRPAVSLTFAAQGVVDPLNTSNPQKVRGDLVMDAGAAILSDPKSAITFTGDTISLNGTVSAPGGTITVTGGRDSNKVFPQTIVPLTTVLLGSSASLSTAGTTLLTPDARGYRTGAVLPGGTVNVSGNIAAQAGAVIDVSGTTGVLDRPAAFSSATDGGAGSLNGLSVVPTREDSAGGAITLAGTQQLVFDGALRGAAGGPAADGGSLTVSSGIYGVAGAGPVVTPLDVNLEVRQAGDTLGATAPAIGRTPVGADGAPLAGHGYFSADRFAAGGFASLALKGTVQFDGPVVLTAAKSLTVATSGVLYADATVALNAPYVALGQVFLAPQSPDLPPAAPFLAGGDPYKFGPSYGTGRLVVNASLIDVGTLSLQNIGAADLIADHGDIRGDGTFDIAGDLYLRAGQIYPPTAVSFTISASDYLSPVTGTMQPGSVKFGAADARPLPLSAGGELNVFASLIHQGGVLRAPLGTINLGWAGTGAAPVDLITGQAVAATDVLTLDSGGTVSVSAKDPVTGKELTIPYGLNLNGTAWIDPTGTDITAGGIPEKSISLSADQVYVASGATVDVAGGGDLLAYRWVSGVGGTKDILGSAAGFAVIPGYQADYAPYAPYNSAGTFAGDAGYVAPGIAVGDRIYLDAGSGLPAGTYTVLPARYALLPGALLVTPKSVAPTGTAAAQPDGSTLVSGYRFNDLNVARTGHPLFATFEVAPQSVVNQRAQYDLSTGTDFLGSHAPAASGQRLPVDAGQLVIAANAAMNFNGSVRSGAPAGGRGGLVDLASAVDIVVGAHGGSSPADTLFLDATQLSAFSAESLLIGGRRGTTAEGTSVEVTAGKVTVNNAGSPLTGSDIILAANDRLTLAPGSVITATAAGGAAQEVTIGDAAQAGSGNGAVVRVSAGGTADVVRAGVDGTESPALTVGAGVQLKGGSVVLDSTALASFDPAAKIDAGSLALGSGRITFALDGAGLLPDASGLVLSGAGLAGLSSAQSVSLSSYSSIDLYGTGTVGGGGLAALALHTAEIRGFNNGGGTAAFAAQAVTLDNRAGGAGPGPQVAPTGTLAFNAGTVTLGDGALAFDQFATVKVTATQGLLARGEGTTTAQGDLTVAAPLITAAAAADHTVTAGGALSLASSASAATVTGGAAAHLAFSGASVAVDTAVVLPSGTVDLTARTGDLTVGGSTAARIAVNGTAQTFFDATRYTDAGAINLFATLGAINLTSRGTLDATAAAGGGNAGRVTVSAPQGSAVLAGALLGFGPAAGLGGSFSFDAGRVPDGNLDSLNRLLDAGGFNLSRELRVRTGDLTFNGTATAHTFDLSADQGSVTIGGTINASGATGGSIRIAAHGGVTLASGAQLNASAQDFDSAGKGGAVDLEAGATLQGVAGDSTAVLNLQNGSVIDLSVASNIPSSTVHATANAAVAFPSATKGNDLVTATSAGTLTLVDGTTVALAANTPTLVSGGAKVTLAGEGDVTFAGSAALGEYTGTLHLRAPRTADNTYVQVAAVGATIRQASAITVEGFQVTDLTGTDGAITAAVRNQARDSAAAFGGGLTSANVLQPGHSADILNRIFAGQGGAAGATGSLARVTPGVEIINRTGDLTLSDNWDLSAWRFGPGVSSAVTGSGAPGFLTLRAAGDLVFNSPASLSDGFIGATYTATLLGAGTQSWTYRLVAGADFGAADFDRVAAGPGSVLIGRGAAPLPETASDSLLRSTIVPNYFQVIRTGTGDISIAAARDVQLLNPLASVYTAGTAAAAMANFATPNLTYQAGALGPVQAPVYAAQFSLGGGNVSITAQQDIAHYLATESGLVADSSRELPTNWLYRRGFVDPATGKFAATRPGGEIASTAWWVDFSNFYEGVGALGGGNVLLSAGRDIRNVDAVVPTAARMPQGVPDASRLVETGGGDLTLRAGGSIDGGAYYVERGQGVLTAGGSITTNATRATLSNNDLINLRIRGLQPDATTWLPTTLFLGKGGFTVSAGGDVLLGPVANPFLLPQGINNSFLDKTYFTTYGTGDGVEVTSLAGDVTLKDSADGGAGSLYEWYRATDLFYFNPGSFAQSQPWLRLAETDLTPFATAAALMPASLRVTVFSGDINLVGRLTLAPSPDGTVDLLAAGAINGVQPNGLINHTLAVSTDNPLLWSSASINLSDANPSRLPSPAAPLSLSAPASDRSGTGWNLTPVDLMDGFNRLFAESGSTRGDYAVIQTKQALHDAAVLHAGDREPVRLYAAEGDISGLTFYSPKPLRAIAGRDITDIALYLQNNAADDLSLVAAGRDLIAYAPNSALRVGAVSPGNALNAWTVGDARPASGSPTAGDIQIGGPGTLELLAGRNFDLGVGPNNSDGTALGVTSIGNARNPFLPFTGADVIVGAGLGASPGLGAGQLDFAAFISRFLDPATAGSTADRYLPQLGDLLGLPGSSRADIWTRFRSRSAEAQDQLALAIFYLVLRDAGRDHNLPASPGYRNYDAGFAAINALFPGKAWAGDISLTSREIKTANGGDIRLFAPGGELTVGFDISGNQAADQGVLTEHGGSINIYTRDNVNVGTSRIFTLRGGDEVIWSSEGNIAAGASSKTVQSAPPTRVLIDPQSADVQTDLAGLATGGGIGVLATVVGVAPGDVDLIAPVGTIDAGDAGIRVSGNINIAAVQVLNAGNVQSSGSAVGVPAAASSGALGGALAGAASSAGAAATGAAAENSRQNRAPARVDELPSLITVEVIGYGGGEGGESHDQDDEKRKKQP
ncbi:MAG: filamentous hemagglutinin family protein [Verrucomicrobia bacterium]|nr:filamentous hemagglutinin family protein [Verrucomicrobiota bacterium]